MRVMAQMAMVMNLDKCIGCHTCSVTCKQAWTNRSGTEYIWFNNVETKPGLGYPRTYEDQEKWKGGWELNKRGRMKLKGGGRLKNLMTIFSNPKLPSIGEYYEPWTYDYATLTDAPAQEHTPVARPKSLISGKNMKIEWSANWDDDLGGSTETAHRDPMLAKIAETSRKRGGIHNSLTRILVKPSHLIGGYAQLAFAFNYLGPTGNQRDEVTVIRRRNQDVEY